MAPATRRSDVGVLAGEQERPAWPHVAVDNSESYRNPNQIGRAMASTQEQDPRQQARRAQRLLEEVRDQLRVDADAVEEPRLGAMLEMSAEVLDGLVRALEDYDGTRS
jgi:hypothetical protein